MKKVLLLCLILLTTAGCSKKELVVNISETKEVDFCDYNDDCDFTLDYESVSINSLTIEDVVVPIELKKTEEKQALFIAEKEIVGVYKVRKIFIYDNLIMVDAYFNENSCENEACRTLLAYKNNGDLVVNLSPRGHGYHFTIGGSNLLSLFIEITSDKDYYIIDGILYVNFTSMDEETYVSKVGERINICNKEALKSEGNVTTFIDDEDIERYTETIVSIYKFEYNGDYTFKTPEKTFGLLMENAIFKYCVEESN